jgi:hypothetical protein
MLSVPKKEPCKYGTDCYRQNPEHRAQFSHPEKPAIVGDVNIADEWTNGNDEEDDVGAKKGENSPLVVPTVTPCPYGKSCYRQNPQHRVEFSHPN